MTSEQQFFSVLVSAYQNRSNGILRLEFSNQAVRQFVFSSAGCIDVMSNSREELPGTFLFKHQLLSEAEYKEYLQKCAASKGNYWGLANPQQKISKEVIEQKKKEHVRAILNNLKLDQLSACTFHAATTPVHGDPIITPLEFFLLVSEKLSTAQIHQLRPEIKIPDTRVTVVSRPEKAILTEDQQGLFTVIEHNQTIGDILDSSFLERELIDRTIFALTSSGLIRMESAAESERRQYFESLSAEQKKSRQILKNYIQKLTSASLYECLNVDPDGDQEDIQKGFETQIKRFQSPDLQNLFYKTEENITQSILDKITNAHGILSDPAKKKEYDLFVRKGDTGSFLDQSQTIQEERILADLGIMVNEGKFVEAVHATIEKIVLFPTFIKLYGFLVDLVVNTGKISDEGLNQRIFSLFKDGISKNPRSGTLFVLLGEWCMALGHIGNATKAFQKALHLHPGAGKIRKYLLKLDPAQGKKIIVEALVQNLQNLNHFEVLGIEPSAGSSEVKAAYHTASKSFHPDLFFANTDGQFKEMSKRVFKEVVASYMELRDDKRRRAYLESLFSSQKKKEEKQKTTAPKSIQARKYYDQAVKFMQDKNFSSAKLNIQLALSYEPENYLLQKMLKDVQTKS